MKVAVNPGLEVYPNNSLSTPFIDWTTLINLHTDGFLVDIDVASISVYSNNEEKPHHHDTRECTYGGRL